MPAPISFPTITNFDLDSLAAGTNGTASFSEGGSAVLLAPNAVLAATGNFGGQSLTISGLLAEDEIGFGAGVSINGHNIKVAGTKIGSFSGGNNGSNLVINFTDGANAASIQTLLRNLTFSDSSHNPAVNQLLTFDLAGTVRTDAVSVAALNDAPVIDAKGSAKYVENDPATTILSKLSISDSDSANLMGAKVSITGNFAAGQDVLGFVNQNGISGSYNASTGVLTLSGSSSLANYKAALQSVTYSNSSNDPSTEKRTISFQVDDGAASNHASNVDTASVKVVDVNDAPVVDLNGAGAGTSAYLYYYVGNPPTKIAPNATVFDVDSANFDGGRLRVDFSLNGSPGDRLAVVTDAVVTVTGGGTVAINGTAIGTVFGGTNGSPLVVLFNSDATQERVAILMEHIGYANTRPSPSTLARTVTFTLRDGDGNGHGGDSSGTAQATIHLGAGSIVGAPDTAPGSGSGSEDTTIAVSLSGSDTDGWVTSFRVTSLPANGTLYSDAGATVAIALNGTVAASGNAATVYFKPNPNYNGAASFQYASIDNGGTQDPTPATASITVVAVNDAPVANADTLAATEDTAVTYTAAQLLGNDTDADGNGLTIASVTGGTGGTAVLNGNGTVTFTPNANFNGAANFSYKATDGTVQSNSATVTVNVAPVNDAPVANADTLAATEDTAVTYTAAQLLGNDTDVDGDTLTIVSVTSGTGGTAVLNGDGTVTFTPNVNFNGAANFSYKATDGTVQSNSATVTVNVAPVNDAPVANADTLAATEDTAVIYTAAQILGNDTDVDGDTLTIVSVTSGTGGTAVLNGDGTVTFTPNANFNGAANFSYKATDGTVQSNSATVTVNVAPVNDAPVANADTLAATEDTAVIYTAAQILGNDTDVDGDALTIASVTSGTGGTPVLNGDGTVTFTPNANFNGAANFTYKATDGTAQSNSATVTVNVAAVNDAPTTDNVLIDTNQNTAISGKLGAADVDSGDVLVFSVETGPQHGTLDLHADGSYTYTPVNGYAGSDSFAFKVTDSGGLHTAGVADVAVASVAAQVRYLGAPSFDEAVNVSSGSGVDVSEVTALADGGHLVVWATFNQSPDSNGYGVFAQRYDEAGHKVGSEFLVNTHTSSEQIHPSAAGLSDGGFVVTWESYSESPDASGYGIFAQRYDAGGNVVGGEFLINQTTAGYQTSSTVSALANGNFVVTWTGANPDNGTIDVYARVFAPGLGGASAVTSEFVVNTDTSGDQDSLGWTAETVTGLAGGRFAVVWSDASGQDGSGAGVFARVYEADGTAVNGAQVAVNTTTADDQNYASVGALGDGGFVVSWVGNDGTSNDIFAQRFDAGGNAVGSEFAVNSFTASDQFAPKVSALSDGGFVIAWMSYGSEGGQTYAIDGQRYDAGGNAVGGEFTINTSDFGNDRYPSLALRDDGALVATWTDYTAKSIEQKIITDFSTDVRPIPNLTFDDVVNSDSGSGVDVSEVTALADGGHLVVWATFNQSPDADGAGVFAQRYDDAGHKVGSEFLVNTYTATDQINPSAAGLSDGGFVVTWESYSESPDASDYGIFAQRYDASGSKVGGEFLINQTTAGYQVSATVSALANGNFVVTWTGANPDNGTIDVYARVFAPGLGGASAVTSEFVVNTDTSGDQDSLGWTAETVTGLSGGRFAVVWSDASGQDGSGAGVFARVYEADGTAVNGAQVAVNTTTAGDQNYASVGALGDGGFVVSWVGNDGTSNDIFAQRFDAGGNAVDSEFAVNSFTASDQFAPKVSALSDGGFVIAWMSYGSEGGQTYAIDGQRYDAGGNAVGGEFTINTSDFGDDRYPSLALRGDGALVATWTDYTNQNIEQKIITSFEMGGAAKDLLGGAGNDSFLGSAMADTLNGGGGNDRLEGLGGNDTLTGGSGADSFVFGLPAHGVDSVMDFVSGTDWLGISATGFGGGLVAGGAATLVSAADAALVLGGVGGYFIFDNAGPNSGTVYWDPTGGSGADAVAFVQLVGVASLQASDLHLL